MLVLRFPGSDGESRPQGDAHPDPNGYIVQSCPNTNPDQYSQDHPSRVDLPFLFILIHVHIPFFAWILHRVRD